ARKDIIEPKIISIVENMSIVKNLLIYAHARIARQIIVSNGPTTPTIFKIRFQFIVIINTLFLKLQNSKKDICQYGKKQSQ
ncbi:MAG: hypothetical protein WCY79_06675, partial [Bacteroidales bacterium]